MDILSYLFLGLLQGITEPLPISSSGHLRLAEYYLNMHFEDLNFEIITNAGSLIAIIIIFRKDILSLIIGFFSYIKTRNTKFEFEFKYSLLLVVATIPTAFIGYLIKDYIEVLLQNINFIGSALIITAIALFLIKDFEGKKEADSITFTDALTVGIFQIFALMPGISRSGATIVGGMFRNLSREAALRFSFLLYIPISVATMLLGITDLIKSPELGALILPYSIGFIFAFLGTYVASIWFIDIVKRGKLAYFSIYCLIVGTLVIIF